MPQQTTGTFILSDDAFVDAFESCTLPKQSFHHRDHIRLAWLYLREGELPVAAARIERSIRGFAAHLGVSEKYHQTITFVWLRLVEAAMRQFPGGGTLEDFLRQHPELLDQNLPFQFYSRERLLSDGARSAWVEPDLKALP